MFTQRLRKKFFILKQYITRFTPILNQVSNTKILCPCILYSATIALHSFRTRRITPKDEIRKQKTKQNTFPTKTNQQQDTYLATCDITKTSTIHPHIHHVILIKDILYQQFFRLKTSTSIDQSFYNSSPTDSATQ